MNKKNQLETQILEQMTLAFGQDLQGMSLAECVPETISSWDSLAFLNLIALLEELYSISVEIDEIEKMSEGGAGILDIISEKVGV